MPSLTSTLVEVRRRIQRQGGRPMNEENTKATLIEPVLRSLGWDVEDVDEVQREFRSQPRHKPVDYGLLVVRTPRLLIEAKALGHDLNDHRWVNQIMGYASVAGVEWVVLTDGDVYRIYNTHAPVVVEEKLFRSVRVTAGDPSVEQTLELLAKNRLEENRIDLLWQAHYVDRQVRAAIEAMFAKGRGEMLLVNYIAGATKNLSTEEIRGSLGRCRATFDFPLEATTAVTPRAQRRGGGSKEKPSGSGRSELVALIASGRLKPPVILMRTYKGVDLDAKVLPGGLVVVGKMEFDSVSTAAAEAMRQVTGVKKSVNGWAFWQVPGPNGERVPLDSFRKARGAGRRGTA